MTAWLLGSSFALGLGVIAGLLDMIPNIGATIAGFILVPALWAEEGLTAALIMLVVLLVYQQVENNVLTPKIQGKAVNLSGFFIIVAVTLSAVARRAGSPDRGAARRDGPDRHPELTKARREKWPPPRRNDSPLKTTKEVGLLLAADYPFFDCSGRCSSSSCG